ncbi:MAG: GspH/FimT family pseudopilin [Luminiphilus sp.]
MRQQGLTLVECLITLAVVAILVAMVTPSFSGQLNAARALTGAHQIYLAAQYARSMAQILETTVTLCPLSSTTDTSRLCGGDFSGTLVAYRVLTDGPAILRVWTPPSGIVVRNRSGLDAVTGEIRWQADGFGQRNLTLSVCAGGHNWTVFINRLGRPRLAKAGGLCPETGAV